VNYGMLFLLLVFNSFILSNASYVVSSDLYLFFFLSLFTVRQGRSILRPQKSVPGDEITPVTKGAT
jgi:hypothetical protein